MKYYALKDENNKLVLNSWDEAKEALKKLVKPKYKSFSTIEEANAFLNDEELIEDFNGPTAYIDGSFDINTNSYSFGGILIIDNKLYKFKKKYDADEFSKYRNVAGEIKGAGYIINQAIKLGLKELHICYDYEGIEKWYTGVWKANSDIAILYTNFANEAKNKISIKFHKIKSHTNNYYNDMADMLAKEALNIK